MSAVPQNMIYKLQCPYTYTLDDLMSATDAAINVTSNWTQSINNLTMDTDFP